MTDIINCAIYTRKSTDEGLDKEFNTLENQYETCLAYINALKDDRIRISPTHYDDGGFSGGNIVRPGLQQLLFDIKCGLIQRIVVYKIDRLTRNIRDFFNLLDVFEKYKVEFISVTENSFYNTTTAPGRLIMSMFMAFAQYERENAGDRIRDKVASSKAKGIWMGGIPPFGYDLGDRCLVINEQEAMIIRQMYKIFTKTQSLITVTNTVNNAGYRTKLYTSRQGKTTGGKKFSVQATQRILQNTLYLGKVKHKDKEYNGQHEAIVDQSVFDSVQAIFATRQIEREPLIKKIENRVSAPAILTGLLRCGCCGSALSPTFCKKGNICYRYYRCYKRIKGIEDKCPINQIRACEIERVVMEQVLTILKTREFFIKYISVHHELDISMTHTLFANLDDVWDNLFENEKIRILHELISAVVIFNDKITIEVKKAGLSKVFAELTENNKIAEIKYRNDDIFQISVPYSGKRLANGAKIIVPATEEKNAPRFNGSLALARHLSQAYEWQKKLNQGYSLQDICASADINERDIRYSLRLLMIDPEIIESILAGKAPSFLTYYFMKTHPIPLYWNDQRKLYGFPERDIQ